MMDWNRENAAAQSQAADGRTALPAGSDEHARGMEQVGETLRGIGGGFRTSSSRGMSRGGMSHGVLYAERELVDNLDLQIGTRPRRSSRTALRSGSSRTRTGSSSSKDLPPSNARCLSSASPSGRAPACLAQEQLRKVHSGVASRYGADLNAPVEP